MGRMHGKSVLVTGAARGMGIELPIDAGHGVLPNYNPSPVP